MTKHTILFLAANPVGSDRLALDREARAIQVELERSGFRDSFELVTRWAAEPLDLLRELRKLKPTVVHFSGHGTVDPAQQGLHFQGPDGRAQVVSADALARVFEAAGSSVKLVLLSACYSDPQAKALVTRIDCVVGMRGSIRDDTARTFAIGFYGGLGERESVAAAYRQGCAAIGLEALPDRDKPRLSIRDGVDAEQLILVADRSAGLALLEPRVPPSAGAVDDSSARTAAITAVARASTNAPGLPIVALVALPLPTAPFLGRDQELRVLDRAWDEDRVVSIVASGGTGKSALLDRWLLSMRRDNYRGAARVFSWSFYVQGTADKTTSSDSFFSRAFEWFGVPEENHLEPRRKGERLAELFSAQRSLLILDGLEPFQQGAPDEGRLRDIALQALLQELAAAPRGLCLITTRIALADPATRKIDLHNLLVPDAVRLLGKLGVRGETQELEAAAREFDCHPLALLLLGTYVTQLYGGDVRYRREIPALTSHPRLGGHAYRVIASYERWFGESAELQVLRVVGLFNRPAADDIVSALRARAIPLLTDRIGPGHVAQWHNARVRLQDLKLVTVRHDSGPTVMDAHPLVRDFFRERLKTDEKLRLAWTAGHAALFDILTATGSAADLPETMEQALPLYSAIAHGCFAGRFADAWDVFWRRLSRGENHFSFSNLNAVSADLTALCCFFSEPFKVLAAPDALPVYEQALLYSHVGHCLRAEGRLRDAVEPLQVAFKMLQSIGDWRNAALRAGNLSRLYLILGDLDRAEALARQGLSIADRSSAIDPRGAAQAAVADVLHHQGAFAEAEAMFRDAETLCPKGGRPRLWGVQGFEYWDLLLDLGRRQEVKERSEQALEWARSTGITVDLAYARLCLGLALLSDGDGRSYGEAGPHIDRAVGDLQQAATQHVLPLGFIARARLHRLASDLVRAGVDLDAAERIITRGEMRLFAVDLALEMAYLELARGNVDAARSAAARADALIKDIGCLAKRGHLANLVARLP